EECGHVRREDSRHYQPGLARRAGRGHDRQTGSQPESCAHGFRPRARASPPLELFTLSAPLLFCSSYFRRDPMKNVVITDRGPKPIGPYSQAIKANGFIFVSGQVALDPKTGEMAGGDIAQQTERALENLKAIVEASGTQLNHVVKTTVYLKNMDDFAAMNEVYARYFTLSPPARSTVQAARLPKDALVEIDVIAAL